MEEVSHHYLILIRKNKIKRLPHLSITIRRLLVDMNTEVIGGYVRKAHASRNGISSHSGSCAY